MSLDHNVKKKGSVAQVRFYDDEDLNKAKFWAHVEVPASPVKSAPEPIYDKLDRILLGIDKANPRLGELDRYRLAALHYCESRNSSAISFSAHPKHSSREARKTNIVTKIETLIINYALSTNERSASV